MLNYQQPDARGHFGPYGGTFVAETLIHALDELKEAYAAAQRDPEFMAEYRSELAHFVGRPSPIYTPRASAANWAVRRSTSSARTSTTPARTRSTTPSDKRCWPGAWASHA